MTHRGNSRGAQRCACIVGGRWRYPAIAAAALNLGGIFASGSLSSLIVMCIGLATLFAVERVRIKVVALVAAVAAVLSYAVLEAIAHTETASPWPNGSRR